MSPAPARQGLSAGLPASLPEGSEQAERKQADQWSAAAKILTVFTIEGAGVASRVRGRRELLDTAGAASALASPQHRPAIAGEAEAMAEQAAGDHRRSRSEPEPER
ncbi:hypothetical protein GCM10009527_083220 [Actinomadura nitritigenes]